MDETCFEFKPVGVVHCASKYRFELPRQGVFSGCDGEIELFSSYGGDAIADLAGFERIWVIFCFHLDAGKQDYDRGRRGDADHHRPAHGELQHRPTGLLQHWRGRGANVLYV